MCATYRCPGPGRGHQPGEALIRSGVLHELLPATFPPVRAPISRGRARHRDRRHRLRCRRRGPGLLLDPLQSVTHTVVSATQLIGKPDALPWEVAGALDVAGTTAFAAVRAAAPGPGDVVAVSAATGGVGALVVQLLVRRGATVLGIASGRAPSGSPTTARSRSSTAMASAIDCAPPPRTGSTRSSTCSDRCTCAWPLTWVSRSTGSRPSSSRPPRPSDLPARPRRRRLRTSPSLTRSSP